MRLALLLLAFSGAALGQYNGPAVDTCLAYAKREAARDGAPAKDIVFERSQNLSIERYGRKLGNQFVASILRGDGAVVLDGTPSAELSFICLLASDKQALFFDWLPRANPSALAQCTRDDALRGKPRPCLEFVLNVAEGDLTVVYAHRFQEARERDDGTGKEASADAFRKANEEWRQYRDAECARQRDQAPKGSAAEDHQLACMVELTRRRALDMR
ncbi:MAG TPA: lysozyme inhibitor LprI family protein [Burkholderiales bacterium]|nr:lysozyme inhibitor LprI family protein [Burkholderiales bacterium]